MASALSIEETRGVYDRLGTLIDLMQFYEGPIVRRLIDAGRFDEARAIIEFGCGTGRVADELLRKDLPPEARYVAVDISPKMVELAGRRLRRWPNARVVRSTGIPLAFEPRSFDRFLSAFVLDILTREAIHETIDEAHRLLVPGGLVCLTSLAPAATPLARVVTGMWEQIWHLSPSLVGGCRPVNLREPFSTNGWHIEHFAEVTQFGLTSAIVVASRLPND